MTASHTMARRNTHSATTAVRGNPPHRETKQERGRPRRSWSHRTGMKRRNEQTLRP